MKKKNIEEQISHLETKEQQALLEHLLSFITDHKRSLFEKYIQYRTRHITMVMEDLYQPHNASAVMRSCDCFGIQDIHIIENKHEFELSKDIALGSDQWVDVYNYKTKEDNTIDCIEQLKAKGYKIIATTPHKNDQLLDDLNIDNKIALVFGTELQGLSDTVFSMADGFVKIPMYGFTESFNISVSAGITLFHLTEKLRKSTINWQLTEDEKLETLINWTCNVIKKPELIISEYCLSKK